MRLSVLTSTEYLINMSSLFWNVMCIPQQRSHSEWYSSEESGLINSLVLFAFTSQSAQYKWVVHPIGSLFQRQLVTSLVAPLPRPRPIYSISISWLKWIWCKVWGGEVCPLQRRLKCLWIKCLCSLVAEEPQRGGLISDCSNAKKKHVTCIFNAMTLKLKSKW
jgi:hypothetical protein